jgi:hypothetical protein
MRGDARRGTSAVAFPRVLVGVVREERVGGAEPPPQLDLEPEDAHARAVMEQGGPDREKGSLVSMVRLTWFQ